MYHIVSYTFFPFHLQKALYTFSLAYLNYQHHHTCALGPVLGKYGYSDTSTVIPQVVDLITKTITEWLMGRQRIQRGYAGLGNFSFNVFELQKTVPTDKKDYCTSPSQDSSSQVGKTSFTPELSLLNVKKTVFFGKPYSKSEQNLSEGVSDFNICPLN